MFKRRTGMAGVILAAEEDPVLFGPMCQALRGEGYHVLAACNGEQALELFCRFAYEIDLALVDVSGGPEVLSRMLSVRADLKVLLVNPEDSTKRSDTRDSPFAAIFKPFTYDRLLSRVRSVLEGESSLKAASAVA